MEGIDDNYLKKAVNDLYSVIGIRESIDESELKLLVRRRKIKECIELMADYFEMSIKVNIIKVPKKYFTHNIDSASGSNKFETTDLVKVNSKTGRGVESIAAQILIPNHVPLFKSKKSNNFPIDIKVSENATKYPETFIAIIAHELAHLFLASVRHKEKSNEIYTDITAMLLGFKDIIKSGRKKTETKKGLYKTTYKTYTYGYLSDFQFHFVFRKISKKLKRNKKSKKKILRKLNSLRKRVKRIEKKTLKLKGLIKVIYKNPKKNISKKEREKISSFYQPGYIKNNKVFIKQNKEKLKEIEKNIPDKQYFKDWSPEIEKDLKAISNCLNKKESELKEDIKILRKNTCFVPMIKLYIKLLFKS